MKIIIEGKVNDVNIRIEEEYDVEKQWNKRYIAIRQWKKAAAEMRGKVQSVAPDSADQERIDAEYQQVMDELEGL